ncbi:MAG TPA: glycosyltransferase [Acidisarcina sp.]
MLLVLPVCFRLVNGNLLFEEQACNGLDRWAEHFTRLSVAAPLMPENVAARRTWIRWRDVSTLDHFHRMKLIPLPWSYSIKKFIRNYRPVAKILRAEIDACEYLQFAIGAFIGDWAAVAAGQAQRRGRKFAIHADRVEHELYLKAATGTRGYRRLRLVSFAMLTKRYHRKIIRGCALGLWHGNDCFRYYASLCKGESRLVHDVHTKPEDAISPIELATKLRREFVDPESPLRIIYAGRTAPMKAPLEWLQALDVARSQGVQIKAVWFGDGSMRAQAQAEAHRLDLTGMVSFPGFTNDRAALLTELRAADVFLFTHVTPESPRCLLESLISGTLILGYESEFAAELLEGRGGGELVAIHDWKKLGERLTELAKDRKQLAALTAEAAKNGRRFSDVGVFADRSELIKLFCATKSFGQEQQALQG